MQPAPFKNIFLLPNAYVCLHLMVLYVTILDPKSLTPILCLLLQVIEQFEELCDRNAMEDAYVMGHRLIAFLLSALPRHPAYAASTKERAITEGHLRRIQKQMKDIAIQIDEEQLNRYITNDFDPVFEEDDEEKKDEEVNNHSLMDNSSETTTWEAFAGWSSFGCDTPPGGIETDESSQDFDSDIEFFDFEKRKVKITESSEDPELEEMISDDEYDSDEESEDAANPFVIHSRPPVLSTSILRKIAREAVHYESDSEAADSWAQDGNGNASDTTSSEVGLLNNTADPTGQLPYTSCDPARLAFRAIMNKHTQQLKSLQLEMERLLADSPPPTENASIPEASQDGSSDSEDEKSPILKQPVHTDARMKTITLPPPAISGPQVLDSLWIPSIAFSPREESPIPPDVPPPTPNNSPDDMHPAIRWGVQLRRTPLPFERKRDLSL
jgi:hypothetical protein